MAITNLPTVGGNLGPVKSNRRPVTDIDRQITAGEWNVAAAAIEAVVAEVGLSDGSTAGSINAERLGNAAEIGEDLADGDHIPVANASAAGAVRKSLLSRVFAYIAQKMFTQNEIGEALTDSDVIAVLDASALTQKTALVSRIYDYLIAKIPLSWGTWTPSVISLGTFTAITPSLGFYVRAGEIVVICGFLTLETAGTGAFTGTISAPVASAFAAAADLRGFLDDTTSGRISDGDIAADATNDAILVRANFGSSGQAFANFLGMYRVL